MKNGVSDFLEFVRFKLCVFAPILGASGHLLSGGMSPELPIVMIVSFLLCTGTYAYNNVCDIKEDSVNRKRVSSMNHSKWAGTVIVSCFALGVLLSLTMNPATFVLSLLITSLGFLYSRFKIKKYLMLKNLYTGFGIGLLFLLGAFSVGNYQPDIFAYYAFFSVTVLAGSLISDLRDHAGDMEAGIKTIPVVFGDARTKNSVYVIFSCMSLLVIFLMHIVPLFFLIIAVCFFISRNKYGVAHLLNIVSVLFTSAWIAIF